MILPTGAPGLTGESDRVPSCDTDCMRRSEGTWLLRRAAMALVEGTSGECTRESGGERGNSGRSSLNLDIVRLGTLEGLRIWIGGVAGAVPTRCGGRGWRDMDSRDVLENDTSDGVVRPWSCELRLPRRNMDANTPMRLPSELRRRVEPRLDVAAVSTVSTGCSEPLRVGSCSCSTDSMGVSCTGFSEMRSGSSETLEGPREWPGAETLPRE